MIDTRYLTRLAALGLALGLPSLGRAAPQNHNFIQSYGGAQTCLMCHGEKGTDFMKTIHWTWSHDNNGQALGKKNVLNNYCIALNSNEPRCTSCHAGVGWKDKTFDFTNPNNIDCLVCHDQTGTYKKNPKGAGAPEASVDLLAVAKSVGYPVKREACGACHFYGGGGDAVKHGDLDSTLKMPSRSLDVHMGVDGANVQCGFCHQANKHEIPGSRYSKAAPDSQLCQDCHEEKDDQGVVISQPHANPLLNSHYSRVACQTCHIPEFARGGKATKMSWDWSTAGQDLPANPDEWGNPTYDKMKGSFVWDANVVPDYVWFNGQVTYTTIDDTLMPGEVVTFNRLHGDVNDPLARIVPVKRFTGRQPFDAGNNTLVVPHLFPTSTNDPSAYWKFYDWNLAIEGGMNYVEKPYSGELGWIDTEMFWVQNHMVAPKEQALNCADCHMIDGRIQFAEMGYPTARARALQNRFFEVAGLDVSTPETVALRWTGVEGFSYQVQYATDLSQQPVAWSNAENGAFTVDAGAQPTELSWTESKPEEPRFYRVIRTDTLP